MSSAQLLGLRSKIALVTLLLSSCGPAHPRPRAAEPPDLRPFVGDENEQWLVQQTDPVGRDDVLPAFKERAEDYGCRTERLGVKSSFYIQGERRSYYGISASCYEGTIAIITLRGGGVRIGCAKPTTLESCNQLLHDIADSR